MTPRDYFQSALKIFNIDQLKSVVQSALDEPLENFTQVGSIPITIFNLLQQLELEDKKLRKFLLFLSKNSSARLKDAARIYYQHFFNIVIEVNDPYTELVVYNDAFVDRQELREKLRYFFKADTHFLLGTKGPRYSGRSHCSSFIRFVAREEDIDPIVFDLAKYNLEQLIRELIDQMYLPFSEFRDRLSQASTQGKGFIAAFKGIMRRDDSLRQKRWCLVFDHHDRTEVDPEVKAFVEEFMLEIAMRNMPADNIFIILLGQGDWAIFPANYNFHVLDVPAPPLVPSDVERYLQSLAKKFDQPLDAAELLRRRDEVLEDIQLNELSGITTMCSRLRKYTTP